MKLTKNTAVAVALGTVFVGGSLSIEAQANPFGYSEMQAGYQLVDGEGKCGEGKCGENMKKAAKEGERGASEAAKEKAKDKSKEGQCGAQMKAMKEGKMKEGKCGEKMEKAKEGKCGADKKAKEGKCGGEQ
ncbi:hypothetical protein [Shewanella sp. Isolate11]|uniref:HvfA family oxazolone/thioamide-modified RiPP metallophore n=1 Tax=Shewanella sp. Isolate11 TaxID=2908530 RepID=UPI001EFDC76D|nr:hypothetical protein [Shewanella sp. Isolate11]MCG9696878.1 hypothetical protein [Shewanella sp. Isolate11]